MSPASFRAPSLVLFGTEPLRAAVEYAGSHLRPPRRQAAWPPRGDGHPVVLFPGLASDGLGVSGWLRLCGSMGLAPYDWGRGINIGPSGDVEAWFDALALEIAAKLQPHRGQRATLIGWSLGGVYAREVARRLPRQVRQVVTVGSPFGGCIAQTRAGWVYRLVNKQPALIDEALLARLRRCPPVPTTAIYSRSDGVVAWQAARQDDDAAGCYENVEVRGSHLGLCWNGRVADVIVDRLAQPDGRWQPYAPERTVSAPALPPRLAS